MLTFWFVIGHCESKTTLWCLSWSLPTTRGCEEKRILNNYCAGTCEECWHPAGIGPWFDSETDNECALDEQWSTSIPGKSSRMRQRSCIQNLRIRWVPSGGIILQFWYRNMQARYCVKWRSSEGKLVLKVTDNTSVSYKMRVYSARRCNMSFQVHQV